MTDFTFVEPEQFKLDRAWLEGPQGVEVIRRIRGSESGLLTIPQILIEQTFEITPFHILVRGNVVRVFVRSSLFFLPLLLRNLGKRH